MKLLEKGEFFLQTPWSIDNKNTKALWNKLSEDDKDLFEFDLTNVDWLDVLTEVWKGVLKYIVKDDISPENQRRNNRRYLL